MASQFYTPRETVVRRLADGREIQVAVKGVPMSLADAIHYEILTDADWTTYALVKPADYGTRYLGIKLADAPAGASQLTTSARGTVVHAQAETDPASRTTTITAQPATPPQPDAGAATGLSSTGGGAVGTTGGVTAPDQGATVGSGERTTSR